MSASRWRDEDHRCLSEAWYQQRGARRLQGNVRLDEVMRFSALNTDMRWQRCGENCTCQLSERLVSGMRSVDANVCNWVAAVVEGAARTSAPS
jgi:hypothetical protein